MANVFIYIIGKIFSEIFSRAEKDDSENWCFPDEREDRFFNKHKDLFEKLEKFRKRQYKSYRFRKVISPFLVVIPFVSLISVCIYFDSIPAYYNYFEITAVLGFTSYFVLIGFVYSFIVSPKRKYERAYKKSFLPRVLRLFGDFSYSHAPKNAIDSHKLFFETAIVPHHNACIVEDHFEGRYKSAFIKFTEIKLMAKSSNLYESEAYVFKGLAILIDIGSKRFFGRTVLCPYRKNLYGELTEHWGLKRVKLVDPEFEKMFNAFGADQVEARYLLDPMIMERLKDLHSECDTGGLLVSFYDNKVFIMMSSSHNHFEPAPLHISARNEQSILRIKKEIEDVLSIIDRLSLYDPQKVHEEKASGNTKSGAA